MFPHFYPISYFENIPKYSSMQPLHRLAKFGAALQSQRILIRGTTRPEDFRAVGSIISCFWRSAKYRFWTAWDQVQNALWHARNRKSFWNHFKSQLQSAPTLDLVVSLTDLAFFLKSFKCFERALDGAGVLPSTDSYESQEIATLHNSLESASEYLHAHTRMSVFTLCYTSENTKHCKISFRGHVNGRRSAI